jgi:hypothetical protein
VLSSAGIVGAATGPYGQFAPLVNVGVDLRFCIRGFLLAPHFSLGLGGQYTTGGVGIGVGYAFALTERLALSPTVDLSYLVPDLGYSPFVVVTGDLPLTIFIGQNGFMEPYLAVGVGLGRGGILVGAGYRVGVTF